MTDGGGRGGLAVAGSGSLQELDFIDPEQTNDLAYPKLRLAGDAHSAVHQGLNFVFLQFVSAANVFRLPFDISDLEPRSV